MRPMGTAMSYENRYNGNGKVTAADAMESMFAGNAPEVTQIQAYWQASALKYIWRFSNKGGEQDITKAIECLQFLLKSLQKNS